MNLDGGEMRDVVQELVANLGGDIMALLHKETCRNRDTEISVQAVADPPGAHIRDLPHEIDVARGMHDRIERGGLHAVERAANDRRR